MELRWLVSVSASAFHAGQALAAGRALIDPALAACLAGPVAGLSAAAAEMQLEPLAVLERLAAQAAGIDHNLRLADAVLVKLVGPRRRDQDVARLARHVAEVEAAYRAIRPDCLEQLERRARPLVEQWESRGPGMLSAMGRLVDPDLLVERADAVVVEPVLGGDGRAHLAHNSVRIEGVLADSEPRLPEVVRLGWLLAQLNLDLPRYGENLPAASRESTIALSVLPLALAAAAEVEWARLSPEMLALAARSWRLAEEDAGAAALAADLDAWWSTYIDARPRWGAALVALDRLLAERR